MLSRFLLIFAACVLSVAGKGFALASPFGRGVPAEHTLLVMVTILATIFLPGFLLGVASCWHGNSHNSNMLRTIIAHPSVVLMPTFTFFAFTSSTKWCKQSVGKEEKEGAGDRKAEEQEKTKKNKEESFITFSPKFTLLNIALSIGFNTVYGISLTQLSIIHLNWSSNLPIDFTYASAYIITIFIPILGLLFTLFFLLIISENSRCLSVAKYILALILANLCLNIVAYLLFFVLYVLIAPKNSPLNLSLLLTVPTLGLLLTILHVILHCCCNRPLPSCWQSTCCNLPEVEFGALVCSDLNKPHILDADGKPKPVLEHEEEDMQGIELVVTELVERLTDQAEEENQEVTKFCLSESNAKRSI